MPTSLMANNPYVVNMVETIPPDERRSLLDVGPGCGSYGVLVRGYVNDPPDEIDAVEVWRPYVERFHLEGIYDTLFVGDVAADRWMIRCRDEDFCSYEIETTAPNVLAAYDVVLMGDVIEHIEKQRALELLDRIPGRIVICTPVDDAPCSGEGYENPAEAHVSHWTRRDWTAISKLRPVEHCEIVNAGWMVRLGRRLR